MLRPIWRDESGETLAEVLVALALFAVFLVLFSGALRTAGALQRRSDRQNAADAGLLAQLYSEGAAVTTGTTTLQFVAEDGDVAFTLPVGYEEVTLHGQEKTAVLHRFATPETAP